MKVLKFAEKIFEKSQKINGVDLQGFAQKKE